MSKITDFIHLHCHSEFSALDGMPKVEEYIIRSSELGFKGLALTEHGNLRSMVQLYMHSRGKFTYAGEKYNLEPIKPIIGCEFYIAPIDHKIKGLPDSEKNKLKRDFDNAGAYKEALKELENKLQIRKRFHILTFAKNQTGLNNLLKLNFHSWKDGFYYRPRIDLDLLKKFHEGLIITTSCIGGWAPQLTLNDKNDEAAVWLRDMKKIFGDDMYVEIQPHNIPEQVTSNIRMMDLAKELKIKVVATNDCHYLLKSDADAHAVLLAIQSRQTLQAQDAWRFDDNAFYLKDKFEMIETFQKNHKTISMKDIQTSLENTMEVYEKCNIELEINKKQAILPNVQIPEKYSNAKQYVIDLCKKGWNWRNIEDRAEAYGKEHGMTKDDAVKKYKDQLKMELERIFRLKFEKYFLIIHELIWWARQQKILVGPGRGSSSGSLVCYLLGITSIDPIKYNLLFDRFLNESRIDYPDIDMDFEDSRRKEIFKHLFDRYGEDHVCLVGTFGRLKGKQALQDVGRVMEIPQWETNQVTKHIIVRSSGDARSSQSVEDSFKEFDVCKAYDKKYPQVLPFVNRLEGKVRQVGIHACGIQLSPMVMEEYIPIEYRTTKNEDEKLLWGSDRLKVSAIDWRDSQDMGLVKIDVLGLKTLTIIKTALTEIEKTYGKKIDLEKIDLEDPKVLDGFSRTLFVGIFQYDSIGMKKTCEKLKFEMFEDVISMNALYRPGCISGDTKIIQNYYTSHNDKKRFIYKSIKELYDSWNSGYGGTAKLRTILSYDTYKQKIIKNEIVSIWKSGKKKVYSIQIKLFQKFSICNNNPQRTRNLKASGEHKLYTLDGWKMMDDISAGDYVLVKYNNTVGKSKRKYGLYSVGVNNKRSSTLQGRARFFYKDECFVCGYNKFTDTCHIDGNRGNNSINNFLILCPNCHREYDAGVVRLNKNDIRNLQKKNWLGNDYENEYVFSKVLSKTYEGIEETYDIECKSPYNNFIAGDVVVHNSMRSGLAQHYINRKIGKEKIEKLHPIYDEITKETQGVLVYQEQLIKCFVNLAGYHPGTADEIRKAVAKSFGSEFINKQKQTFVDGAVLKGMDRKKAEALFENISFFGSYAFNKSHAAAYAVIAYWGMYLKIYYPTQFFYSLMRHENDQQQILRFVSEARTSGIEVLTPDVNYSDIQFSIEADRKIVSGLVDIKGCGEKASNEIVKNQPYKNLTDMLNKVERRQVHRGVIGALVKAGAFRSMYSSIGAMIKEVTLVIKKKKSEEEITKPVYDWMMDMKEADAEAFYKKYDTAENKLDEEHEVRVMSEVCPIPPYKHKTEYYDKISKYIFTDRENIHNYVMYDENYNHDFEFNDEEGMRRNRCLFRGTLVDIKYNNVGDFHKDEPDAKTKQRIGWGKRYSNINIEDTFSIKRINIDIDVFPTFREIIDKGLQTPIIVIGSLIKFSEVIHADILIDLDSFRDKMEKKLSLKDRYKLLNPWEKYLLKHPISLIKDDVKKNSISINHYNINIPAGNKIIVGLITRVKIHWTKKDKKMAFVNIEDMTGYLSAVMWAEGLEKYHEEIRSGNIVRMWIKKDKYGYQIDQNRKIELIKTVWTMTGKSSGDIIYDE